MTRRHLSNRERIYLAGLDAEQAKHHLNVRRYPSGRRSRGGANRSSSLRREIGLRTTTVTLCLICGGVSPDVAALTSLFPTCICGTFRVT